MRIKAVIVILVVLALLTMFSGCKKEVYDPNLSDLGGAFLADEEDLDFDLEVSGRLSEGNENVEEDIRDIYAEEEELESFAAVNGGSQTDSKLLRWGISRMPDNQTPNADPGAPQLLEKYGAAYIGDTAKKEIYLTFDEGYENGYTPKILDVLRDNKVQGVFFITGPYLKEHQDLVKRMLDEGHIVGNHSIHHPSLPSLGDKELEEEILGLDRAFNEKFGKNMKYLRPPKGEYSERTLALTKKLGYCNLFWSFAYDDWYRDKFRGADYSYNMVMKNLHNGAVLLLHAVSRDNADALDRIIKGAKEMGYTFGSVDNIKLN